MTHPINPSFFKCYECKNDIPLFESYFYIASKEEIRRMCKECIGKPQPEDEQNEQQK